MKPNRRTYDFRQIELPRLAYQVGRGKFYYYGDRNDYPLFLNSLLRSPIHHGIIKSKVYYILEGRQLVYPNAPGVHIAEGDWRALFEALAYDYEISNQAYVFVTKLTNGWELRHQPYSSVRVADTGYYISDNWQRACDREFVHDIALAFTAQPGDSFLYRLSASTLPAYVDYQTNTLQTSHIYPAPPYEGGIYAILADIETQRYQYNEIVNSFKGGTLVELPDFTSSEEERQRIAERIKEELTSQNHETGIVVSFKAPGEPSGASIMPIAGSDTAARYTAIRSDIITNIVIAHSVTSPELIGVAIPGQLGGTTSREESYAIFEKTYISARRKAIVSAVNNVLAAIGSDGRVRVVDPTTQPVAAVSLSAVVDVADLFAQCGQPRHVYSSFIASAPVLGHEDWHAYVEFGSHRDEFKTALDETDYFILELVNGGADLSQIVEATKSKPDTLRRIAQLVKAGYIKPPEPQGRLALSVRGLIAIFGRENLRVVYTYEERKDAPPLLTQSRPFCKKMMSLNRAYTRQEIDRISSIIGRDVWLYRGGWYHNWQTGQNEPACRHEWRQHIVKV